MSPCEAGIGELGLDEFRSTLNEKPDHGTLSGWGGHDFLGDLVVGDALYDPRLELRRLALYHLPDARPKLAEEVDPRAAANRRTKIVERRRSGSRPIWPVSSVDSNRSHYGEKIRRVQPSFSRIATSYEKA